MSYPQRDSSESDRVLSCRPGRGSPKTIWSCSDARQCRLVSGRREDAALFAAVLSVRERTDTRWPDQETPVDRHSTHYSMLVDDAPVGCLSVTRATDGELFLQEYCPPPLLQEYGDRLVSAYRFRILAPYRAASRHVPGVSLSRHMVREAWREQIALGAGIDLINIERRYLPLYTRLGYALCEGCDYIDPVLGTASCLMFLPVDPDRPSCIQDIIRGTDRRLSYGDVIRCLTRLRVPVDRALGAPLPPSDA